jgi:hypothetical protein
MTLQSLGKILDKYDQQLGSINTQQLELLRGLPFYNFQDPTDTNTFNHRIGFPRKNGVEFPLFDHEQLLYNELQSHKHLWIKKATGLGITEFMLRYMVWLCFCKDFSEGSQMCIVTGPRIELAITLIDRMKQLFRGSDRSDLIFDTKETVIELNGVHIEAYPSHHLDAMKLIVSLRTATVTEEWKLDKQQTSHHDIQDSFRLASQ